MHCVDFEKTAGRIRPELYSSGLGAQLVGSDATRPGYLRDLHFKAARTHDWALTNPGQRILDTHFVFPLLHLDAADPRNYFFGPTDEILKLTIEDLGLDVMYRMGSSIESVNARRRWDDPSAPKPGYYNCVEPADWDKYADVLSGIIRHYTRGWAKGYQWGERIRYWELWNEPNDRPGGSWLNADGDFDTERNHARFWKFFPHVLKRLKAEFPELKFGGPSVCFPDKRFLKGMLEECRKVGYAPDFVTYHGYGSRPAEVLCVPSDMRSFLDELGFEQTELILNEWHYIPHPGIWGDFGASPERFKNVIDPEDGLAGIDSAIFTLQAFAGFQESDLDQCYFYGCGHGHGQHWGLRNYDGTCNKVYYALKMFGTVLSDCDVFAAVTHAPDEPGAVRCFAAPSRDGRRKYLIVSRFKPGARDFDVVVNGLEGFEPTSVLALDRERDLEEIKTPEGDGKADASFTPFSPSVATPIYFRQGERFRFQCWKGSSEAWLIVFEKP
ncbi:MAG: GH39 family glycosyl hydrolase [Kiritimatiellia bacterium]|jgi:hypothetical protein